MRRMMETATMLHDKEDLALALLFNCQDQGREGGRGEVDLQTAEGEHAEDGDFLRFADL